MMRPYRRPTYAWKLEYQFSLSPNDPAAAAVFVSFHPEFSPLRGPETGMMRPKCLSPYWELDSLEKCTGCIPGGLGIKIRGVDWQMRAYASSIV